MKYIPHPAALAAISAATGRRLQASDHDDAGRARPKTCTPHPYTAKGVAAYRWPDGRVGIAYDMYAPQYPEGAEPGIATIHYDVQHFPNDTSGYRPEILDFKDVPALEAEGINVDPMAAGLILRDDRAALAITADEAGMAEIDARLSEGARLIRAPINHVDLAAGGEMRCFIAAHTRGAGLEIMAATDEAALHRALAERFRFIEPSKDFGEFSANLRRHAHTHGWVLCETDPESAPAAVRDHLDMPLADGEGPQF